jgi:ABC-2 type transport system permease protein
MMGFRVLLAKEVREQLRTGRIVAVAAVFVLFGILGPLTDRYMKNIIEFIGSQGGAGGMQITVPDPSLKGSLAQIGKNLSQFGYICAILLAMGAVAWEKERGTAGMIMTKPASRAAFLTAKLVAIAANLAIATLLGTGLGYLYTTLLYPDTFPLGGYTAMALTLWWTSVIFAAITLLASTATRSAIAAAGIGLVAFLIFGIVVAIEPLAIWSPIGLVPEISKLAIREPTTNFLWPLVFNVALVPVLMALAWLDFRRQEL